nr:transposase [Alteromonas lipotrueiana]
MPRPRKCLISLDDTPYYHCISRCVRKAFLCGKDPSSGKSYEHRRHWVEQRILFLSSVFSIEICAYAVMSNHTHLVLFVDKQQALKWSDLEVLKRWHKLHKGTVLTRRYMYEPERIRLTDAEINSVKATIEVYRRRLFDISWYMRLLNEYIARKANKEDHCTGHFWEGRFKSQALLDEPALLACMAYVDLNPVRANMAKNPQSSAYTSIKKRLNAAKHNAQPNRLCHFNNNLKQHSRGLPFLLSDYLALIQTTCQRIIRSDKPCEISKATTLKKHQLSERDWQSLIGAIEAKFGTRISMKIARTRLVVSSIADAC